MQDSDHEIELKFLLDADAARRVKARIRALPGLEGAPVTRTLRSVYYDTPDQALRRAGIALRMRRDGRRWIQTVKARSRTDGALHSALEDEATAPGGRLDLALVADADLRGQLHALTDDAPLAPVCETAIRRSLSVVTIDGTARAELALDQGEIIAGDHAMPLHELEIELMEGSVGALFDVARTLFADGAMTFSRQSKAARGYMLAREGRIGAPPAPRMAREVPLDPAQSVETAARDILRECFEQVSRNAEVCRAMDAPEGPHQLRIGLRRLRSAVSVLRPAIGCAEMTRLGAEARWLGRQVGVQRDLDVALGDLLEPEAAARPDDPALAALRDVLVSAGAANRARLRATLESARTLAFLLDLGRFIETRGWRAAGAKGRARRLSRPVAKLGRKALDRRWKAVRRAATGIETLDIPARHALRKELKKLRYAIEFLSPTLRRERVKPFVRRLRALQEVFGDLNDAAMLEALFDGRDAPGTGCASAQRGIGWLVGTRSERAAHHWHDAKALWRDLDRTGPCW